MKKIILVLAFSCMSLFAVCDPINDPASCIGPQGVPGVDGANAWEYESLEAGLAALGGIELNPTHKGFSMAIGAAQTDISVNGGAIGIMYVFDTKETKGFTSAINVKAYKAQKGASGVTGGITLSF
jgi:hypothetical protein